MIKVNSLKNSAKVGMGETTGKTRKCEDRSRYYSPEPGPRWPLTATAEGPGSPGDPSGPLGRLFVCRVYRERTTKWILHPETLCVAGPAQKGLKSL